jgi:uncharacterized protein YjdB
MVYNWTRTTPAGITTAIATSGSGDINGIFTNNTTAPITVTFTITPKVDCKTDTPFTATVIVNPKPTAVISGTKSICIGQTADITITLTGTSPWSVTYTETTASGTVTNTVPGIISTTFIFAVAPTVNTTYAITAVSDANCTGTFSGSAVITVNPLPTITGTLNVCVGSSITLTGSPTKAAANPWVSSNPGIATVTVNGVVTGVAAGTTTITYTNTNGCQQTATVTVNALPTITGTLSACKGATTQLTGSGTPAAVNPWVSSNTSIATVSSTGLVTGVAAGTATITYTDSNGCVKTATVTITPKPTPIITHN